jgi:signal transduction histidine kinase
VGAVVVEETTASIQLLKQSALESLLGVSLLLVFAALVALLGFAGWLATRIRRLHAQAEAAIDSQGRVRGTIATYAGERRDRGSHAHHVRGARAACGVTTRTSKRWPGACRTSCARPWRWCAPRSTTCASSRSPRRARLRGARGRGRGRLARLISRLSEPTRLERMLESAERERFDLAQVVAGCVEGYRAAYAPRVFELERPDGPRGSRACPIAFAQLLDKLAENAHDFAPAGTAHPRVARARGRAGRLAVENAGPPLPEPRPRGSSIRWSRCASPRAARERAHLGLGLYIVRLVAEFHGGRVRAETCRGQGRALRSGTAVNSARRSHGDSPLARVLLLLIIAFLVYLVLAQLFRAQTKKPPEDAAVTTRGRGHGRLRALRGERAAQRDARRGGRLVCAANPNCSDVSSAAEDLRTRAKPRLRACPSSSRRTTSPGERSRVFCFYRVVLAHLRGARRSCS